MAAYNANDTGILLESGTNELELLEFNVCGNSYGINIAKVREIMMEQELVPMPQAPDEIEGVFMPRDKLITVIDLHKVLGTEKRIIHNLRVQRNGYRLSRYGSAGHTAYRLDSYRKATSGFG